MIWFAEKGKLSKSGALKTNHFQICLSCTGKSLLFLYVVWLLFLSLLKIYRRRTHLTTLGINKLPMWQPKWLVWASTIAKIASDLQGGPRPSEDLACLINIYLLRREVKEAYGGGGNGQCAHHSLGIMCRLPFKTHMRFISALRHHKLNAGGPLIWALTGRSRGYWVGVVFFRFTSQDTKRGKACPLPALHQSQVSSRPLPFHTF